ncbi:ribose-phosphate diphosphokinase [Aestuariivirga sp.]|uniref:ribose-phosphate diphosphokinase n=1 Tax=Aestuariivirga sp. TaxID=2650926 RepID=UPI00391BC047
MRIFALSSTTAFGHEVARLLDREPDLHEERGFEDGEHKTRPLVSVRGHSVHVVQSLHGGPEEGVNDKLCKLLFFVATLKSNGAARVTAHVPYLAYSRKDRQTKSRDPVTTQSIARLLEASGADCVVTLDVHNIVAFQNAFRCETVHLDTRRLFIDRLAERLSGRPVSVVSPDPGGVKRAQLFREMLEGRLGRPVGQAFMEKRRTAGVVTGELLVGDVRGTLAIVVDDLISSGGTMAKAAVALRDHGAESVTCCAAHGLFTGNAEATLSRAELDHILISDSVPPFRITSAFVASRCEIVSAAPLFAGAIRCLEGSGSISALLGEGA